METEENKKNRKWMAHAIRLAEKGKGWVNPNPLVGAMLIKNESVIGEGFHAFFGGPHAEVNAVNNSTETVKDSTLVVTFEPCIHQGKTPPCAPFIVENGITKVIVGMKDPNPLVNGRGIEYLRSHGVKVQTGVMEDEIRNQNEVFLKFITLHIPFCVLKTAMTLDGKIATITGESKWISGERSRKLGHELRHQVSAIMVGKNTILKDNPWLDVRRDGKKNKDPLKIVVDTFGKIPLNSNILTHEPQLTIIATTSSAPEEKVKELQRLGAQVMVCPTKNKVVDLVFLMENLGKMEIDSILIEGGGTLAFSALKEGIVDKFIGFIAPKIVGGVDALTVVEGEGIGTLSEAMTVHRMKIKKLDNDFYFEGYLNSGL